MRRKIFCTGGCSNPSTRLQTPPSFYTLGAGQSALPWYPAFHERYRGVVFFIALAPEVCVGFSWAGSQLGVEWHTDYVLPIHGGKHLVTVELTLIRAGMVCCLSPKLYVGFREWLVWVGVPRVSPACLKTQDFGWMVVQQRSVWVDGRMDSYYLLKNAALHPGVTL